MSAHYITHVQCGMGLYSCIPGPISRTSGSVSVCLRALANLRMPILRVNSQKTSSDWPHQSGWEWRPSFKVQKGEQKSKGYANIPTVIFPQFKHYKTLFLGFPVEGSGVQDPPLSRKYAHFLHICIRLVSLAIHRNYLSVTNRSLPSHLNTAQQFSSFCNRLMSAT